MMNKKQLYLERGIFHVSLLHYLAREGNLSKIVLILHMIVNLLSYWRPELPGSLI